MIATILRLLIMSVIVLAIAYVMVYYSPPEESTPATPAQIEPK